MLLSALSVGKSLPVDRESATVDDLFKCLQEVANQMPKLVAAASVSNSGRPGGNGPQGSGASSSTHFYQSNHQSSKSMVSPETKKAADL